MEKRTVTVCGCGSVGSNLAVILARMGLVDTFMLVDGDTVEMKNLTKSVFATKDVGVPKVDALAEHIRGVNPSTSVATYWKFIEDLTPGEWHTILERSDLILELADSRSGTEVCATSMRENYERTSRSPLLVKMICLDNAAAGLTMIWTPQASQMLCPACVLNATPLIGTSDDRIAGETGEDYSPDRAIGFAVRGVLSDLMFGIGYTVSLIHGLLTGADSGRLSIAAPLLDNQAKPHNVVVWSPFRDPYLSWQKAMAKPMGSVMPLNLEGVAGCPVCGRNMPDEKDDHISSKLLV